MNNPDNKQHNNSFYTTILVLLCTSLIILTNTISSRNLVKSIKDEFMEIEYNQIGGKENYELVKELQKNEILNYIETIKKEKPELVENIEKKIKAKNNNFKFLSDEEVTDLKENAYLKGNSGSLISIIEFSDLECEYCIELHKSNFLDNLFEEYDNINYIFKNFVLPTHENSQIEAQASICIKNLSENKENYEIFIEKIFHNSNGGGEGLDLTLLNNFAEEIGININEFNQCLEENRYLEQIQNEFNQGIELGIDSVPSTIILNNETGEYILLKEKIDEEKFKEYINKLIN